MNVNFDHRPNMFAVELEHSVTVEVPLTLAAMLRNEIDHEASFHGRSFDAWYGVAQVQVPGRSAELELPFALHIAHDETAALTVRFCEHDLWGSILACLILPTIQVIEQPTAGGFRAREVA